VNDTFTFVLNQPEVSYFNVLTNDVVNPGGQAAVYDPASNEINTGQFPGIGMSLNSDGTLMAYSYNDVGPQTLTYTYQAVDKVSHLMSQSATITINVVEPPTPPGPPTVKDDTFGPFYSNGASNLDVLQNDTSNAGPLRIVSYTQGHGSENATVKLVNGKFQVTDVRPGRKLWVSFEYTVANDVGESTAKATINYKEIKPPRIKRLKKYKPANHRKHRKAQPAQLKLTNPNRETILFRYWNDDYNGTAVHSVRIPHGKTVKLKRLKFHYLGYDAFLLTPKPLHYYEYDVDLWR
jgi:hypothetical protein